MVHTLRLNPKIYKLIITDINDGKNLEIILEENKNSEFKKEIISHYYHINNGPDLRDYQQIIVNKLINYYKNCDIFKLFWCCGLGKTKTSLTIVKKMNVKKILILVPSKILISQFYEELELCFLNSEIFVNCSDYDNIDEDKFINYIYKNKKKQIILSTYHSSKKILDITKKINYKFDFIIYDESHHLIKKNSKKFIYALKIPVDKRLYLTATPYLEKETKNLYSMEESNYFKGDYDMKNINWGIKNGFITDYRIIICSIDINDIKKEILKKYEDNDKKLIISGYMAYKALITNNSNKILIYGNKVENAKIIKKIIIDIIKFEKCESNIFVDELNGNNSEKEREICLKKFSKSKKAVLCSVQLFGEGYDCPELDSVLFAEKMESDIRIIQSGLRCCRLDPNNKNKIGKILLPITDDNDDVIKQVILKMKQHDNVIKKISDYKQNPNPIPNPNPTPTPTPNPNYIQIDKNKNNEIINKIKLSYLKEEIINQTITTNNSINFKQDINIVLLSPISINSINNFYNSILSKNYEEECYWGFKQGNYDKIYKLLKKDDVIMFIETNYVTICNIITKKIDESIAINFWNDKDFKYTVKMNLIKRFKFDKKELLKNLGYNENDNLMGSRIFNFTKYNSEYMSKILLLDNKEIQNNKSKLQIKRAEQHKKRKNNPKRLHCPFNCHAIRTTEDGLRSHLGLISEKFPNPSNNCTKKPKNIQKSEMEKIVLEVLKKNKYQQK